jgi:hypothetical protein
MTQPKPKYDDLDPESWPEPRESSVTKENVEFVLQAIGVIVGLSMLVVLVLVIAVVGAVLAVPYLIGVPVFFNCKYVIEAKGGGVAAGAVGPESAQTDTGR